MRAYSEIEFDSSVLLFGSAAMDDVYQVLSGNSQPARTYSFGPGKAKDTSEVDVCELSLEESKTPPPE